MERNFGGIIWTNHALARLRERGIKQGDAWATFRNPDQSRFAERKGVFIFYKTYGSTRIEVAAKKNEKGEWLVLSVWSGSVYLNKKKPEPLLGLIFRRIKDLFS